MVFPLMLYHLGVSRSLSAWPYQAVRPHATSRHGFSHRGRRAAIVDEALCLSVGWGLMGPAGPAALDTFPPAA